MFVLLLLYRCLEGRFCDEPRLYWQYMKTNLLRLDALSSAFPSFSTQTTWRWRRNCVEASNKVRASCMSNCLFTQNDLKFVQGLSWVAEKVSDTFKRFSRVVAPYILTTFKAKKGSRLGVLVVPWNDSRVPF